MKLHDSLRQECMPEMVYSICKLAGSKKYTKDNIYKLITLGNTDSSPFNKVYRFSIECGFIEEKSDEIVKVNFSSKELETFKSFRYAIFMKIFKGENTLFNQVSKWFLSQNNSVFKYKSAQDLSVVIPNDVFSGVEKDYVLGFRFWMVALGLCMLQKSGAGSTLVFSTNIILREWLENENPFKKNSVILVRDFINKLIIDCPLFECCISGNDINFALSIGLRVLHINNVIELRYTTDTGDIWHLTESISDAKTNNITEIIVR